MPNTIKQPPVHRIILVQLSLSFAVALAFLFQDQNAAISALVGGLISTVPNAYFIYKAFMYRGARQISQALQSFYQGGAWKMVLTAIGFALAFKLLQPVNITALFTGFLLVQTSNVFNAKIANF
ncbi:ATP synthase subunit I [Bermanella sp. R86510]|uniref:ATP synthase subunit I n=1 Tax=unclassified Bermanella TaxID=2627862 RepID=UPI0037C82570